MQTRERVPSASDGATSSLAGPQAAPRQFGAGGSNAERAGRLGLGQGAGESGAALQTGADVAAPAVGGLDGGKATPMAATGPTITVENFVESPDGAKDRTTVGLGETTWFTPETTGVKFSSSGGTGTMEKDGAYKWVAPATEGDHTITATDTTGTTTIKVKVVAPSAVKGTKTGEFTEGYSAGTHGAGMTLDLVLQPTTVNFQNLEWKEKQGAITGTGVMKGREPTIKHNPEWSTVGSKNEIKDTAEHHGFPKPWGAGTTVFEVEQHYRVGAKGTAKKIEPAVKQVHEIFGADGEAQERKAGAESNKRKP